MRRLPSLGRALSCRQHAAVQLRYVTAGDVLTSPAGLAALLSPRTPSGSANKGTSTGSGDRSSSAGGEAGSGGGSWRGALHEHRHALLLGAIIFVASSLSDIVRARMERLRTLAQEYLYVNFEVRSHQPEYQMLLEWLSKQPIGSTSHNMALRAVQSDRLNPFADSDSAKEEARLWHLTGSAELLRRSKAEHRAQRQQAQTALRQLNAVAADAAAVSDAIDDAEPEADTTFNAMLAKPPLPPPHSSSATASGLDHQPSQQQLQRHQNLFVPGYGVHRVQFEGSTVWVSRDIDTERKTGAPADDRSPDEVLTFMTLGWNRRLMERLVEDARMTAVRDHVHSTRIHVPRWGQWELLTEKPKRYLDSVFLPTSLKGTLSNELRAFFAQRDVYRALGIPWRRGYMFYGPPGTGKSSLILAMAGEHNLPVYVLPMDAEITDSKFLTLVNAVPTTASLLVIEDLDTAIAGIQERMSSGGGGHQQGDDADKPGHAAGLSISGVLNAIDGIASSEGRVLIVTSNTPTSRLPPALLRPGRVDRVVEFGPVEEPELRAMLQHFGCDEQSRQRLVQEGAGVVSPATVQAALQLASFKCSAASLRRDVPAPAPAV